MHQARIRPEIQALRAIAVSLVVLNHLWPNQLAGGFIGVDIFFVISGFLITGHLFRELQTTGRVRLARFWARRARRLLPAALLVLLAALIGTRVFIPISEWETVAAQITSSALYIQNWALTAQATNYFTSADSASPVTHFWSLAVEEQFYIVWPLVILLVALISRRSRTPQAHIVFVAVGAIVVFSMVYSVWLTSEAPSAAYFSTFTRAWEFGAGGLLAIASSRLPIRDKPAALTGWVGWALIVLSLILIHEGSAFPGLIAGLPVLATLLVIVGGSPSSTFSATWLISRPTIQFIGNISYSIYLWHWVLIVLVPFATGVPLYPIAKALVLASSVLLAWITKVAVEDPLRVAGVLSRAASWRTLLSAAIAMGLVVSSGIATSTSVDARRDAALAQLVSMTDQLPDCVGAAALSASAECSTIYDLAVPDAILLNAYNQGNPVDRGSTCQQLPTVSAILSCSFGAPAETASLTIAMTGDSHVGQYIGALNLLAEQHQWHVVLYIRSSCPAALSIDLAPNWAPQTGESCREWQAEVVEKIATDSSIDLVVTSSISREYNRYDSADNVIDNNIAGDFSRAWTRWLDSGKRVLVIGDSARMNIGDIPTCIALSRGSDPCRVPAKAALLPDPMLIAASSIDDPHLATFDPNPYICSDSWCHSVVGGIPVFADANHFSTAFSRTLAPFVYSSIPASFLGEN